MANHKEMADLSAAALKAIAVALSVGDAQGHEEHWRAELVDHHLLHARDHAKTAYTFSCSQRREASQALCRLAMALVKMDE